LTSAITIRRTRRDDVPAIIEMLADDHLGRARERLEQPLPASYYEAFARVDRDPLFRLVVAEQGGSRGLIEDVRVASDCRSRGIGEQLVQWAVAEARGNGCKLVELLTHHTRVDAQRFYERLGFARSHVGMTIRF
jgi:ribosomal protein S18 acetylase RimI-like enzyme